jgi:hypothetical protein
VVDISTTTTVRESAGLFLEFIASQLFVIVSLTYASQHRDPGFLFRFQRLQRGDIHINQFGGCFRFLDGSRRLSFIKSRK